MRLKDEEPGFFRGAFGQLAVSMSFPALMWAIWFVVMALAPCSCMREGCSVQQVPARCSP